MSGSKSPPMTIFQKYTHMYMYRSKCQLRGHIILLSEFYYNFHRPHRVHLHEDFFPQSLNSFSSSCNLIAGTGGFTTTPSPSILLSDRSLKMLP